MQSTDKAQTTRRQVYSLSTPPPEHNLGFHVRCYVLSEVTVHRAIHRSVFQLDIVVKEDMSEHCLDLIDSKKPPGATEEH